MPSTACALRVFLADDSPAIRSRIAVLLADHAVEVIGEAESPQACIAGIRATHPDVVVLDVQLAGGVGLDVLRAVRSAQPDIAFIVFSNNSGPAYRKRYLAAGAMRFLDKSDEFDQLAAAVCAASQTQ